MNNLKLSSIYALYKGDCIINLSLTPVNQNIPQLCRLFLGLTSFFEQEISHVNLLPNYYSIYSRDDLIIVLETSLSNLKDFYSFILKEVAHHIKIEDLKLLNISKQNPEDYTIDSSLQSQNLQQYQTKPILSYFVSNYLKPILLSPLPNLHQIPFISLFFLSQSKQSILFQYPNQCDYSNHPYSFIFTESNYNLYYRVCKKIPDYHDRYNATSDFEWSLIYDLAKDIEDKKAFVTFYYYMLNDDYCLICCCENKELLKESSIPFPLLDLPTTDKQMYFFQRDQSVIPDIFQPYLSDLLQYISLLRKPMDSLILKPHSPNGTEKKKSYRFKRNLHIDTEFNQNIKFK